MHLLLKQKWLSAPYPQSADELFCAVLLQSAVSSLMMCFSPGSSGITGVTTNLPGSPDATQIPPSWNTHQLLCLLLSKFRRVLFYLFIFSFSTVAVAHAQMHASLRQFMRINTRSQINSSVWLCTQIAYTLPHIHTPTPTDRPLSEADAATRSKRQISYFISLSSACFSSLLTCPAMPEGQKLNSRGPNFLKWNDCQLNFAPSFLRSEIKLTFQFVFVQRTEFQTEKATVLTCVSLARCLRESGVVWLWSLQQACSVQHLRVSSWSLWRADIRLIRATKQEAAVCTRVFTHLHVQMQPCCQMHACARINGISVHVELSFAVGDYFTMRVHSSERASLFFFHIGVCVWGWVHAWVVCWQAVLPLGRVGGWGGGGLNGWVLLLSREQTLRQPLTHD